MLKVWFYAPLKVNGIDVLGASDENDVFGDAEMDLTDFSAMSGNVRRGLKLLTELKTVRFQLRIY